jgi:ParB family chromosome partitioning protein
MANVRYKKPSEGMERMIIKPEVSDRPSLGMTEVRGEIYYLSPDIIIPYKNQARKDMDEVALSELAESIQSQGIIQPLQIIPSLASKGNFEVVSGERRLRAAKNIGLDKVPCIILDRDRDADEIALIENIQRENLHPIELADAVSKILEEKKYGDHKEIAKRIGISKSQISQLLAISRLPEDVKQHLLYNKNIRINFLRKLAYLKNENEVREKVFGEPHVCDAYKSIIRVSFNGDTFKFDQLKIEQLSLSEKGRLKDEMSDLIKKLSS